MTTRTARLFALCGFLIAGGASVALQAHHAVAGVYDLNKEVVLQGKLTKLNFVNPHASIVMEVVNQDGSTTEWVLTTASVQVLTRQGLNKSSIKPGEILKVTVLPAKNGHPVGFIRSLELGDKEIQLFFANEQN
jgi:DNA/RNA endonuclease YhcR with UshA esterase domain